MAKWLNRLYESEQSQYTWENYKTNDTYGRIDSEELFQGKLTDEIRYQVAQQLDGHKISFIGGGFVTVRPSNIVKMEVTPKHRLRVTFKLEWGSEDGKRSPAEAHSTFRNAADE